MAFAFPWHRDVWYSAPAQQINWWLPVFPVRESNAMSFDLPSFDQAVPNTSGGFDYYRNNAQRLTTAKSVTSEQQARPRAVDHNPPHGLIPLQAPGSVLLFSGAQLHTSIPNTSGLAPIQRGLPDGRRLRRSGGRGARLVDVHCTGTSIRDFVSVAGESRFDESLVRSLFGDPQADAMLVFGAPDENEPANA